MNRLSAYLARIFASEALSLLGVAVVLVFLVQCLRIFDVVSVKGQGVLTLFGNALLTMPSLITVFLYVCMGIGLGRGLRALQASTELHIIHTNGRTGALLGAVGIYAALGAGAVLIIANFVEPASNRRFAEWSASITADLVGRTLTPHRFTQVVPDVYMVIGGREGGGKITEFFADDRRDPDVRRTYFAKSATVAADELGYVLQLEDGALQYQAPGQKLSEVAFQRYDIGLEGFSSATVSNGLAERNSATIVSDALATGEWPPEVQKILATRMGEGLRVIAMCAFVAAIAMFPHGRRGRWGFPIELTVLLAAFTERGVSSYLKSLPWLQPLSGAALLLLVGVVVLAFRFRPRGGFKPSSRAKLSEAPA